MSKPGFVDIVQGGVRNDLYRDAYGSRADIFDFSSGYNFQAQNDLNRLEVLSSNELPEARRGFERQLTGIENIANRVGEDAAIKKDAVASAAKSDRDEAQFERATRGMDLSDRQKKAAGRRQGLARSLNRAMTQGETRRGFTDRARAATAQGGGFADAMFSQRVAGETNLAQAYMNRQAAAAQRKADKKSATMGAIGTVVGGALAFFSSEDYKDDLGREPQLLDKLKKVRVNRWKYKGDKRSHVGPFSEEFNREFGIDTDRPDMISVIDALGVTLGAVKELDLKVSQQAAQHG